MNNFFSAVISLMQLSPTSQNGAGVLYLICATALAGGASGTYTAGSNPFTALKNAITGAANGERPTAFRGDAENALVSAENSWAQAH